MRPEIIVLTFVLRVETLEELIPLFFVFNHINHVRWFQFIKGHDAIEK